MANAITLLRIPLLISILLLLYQPTSVPRAVAAFLIIVLIAMDSLDGYVARQRGESSLLGGVLDIAADRTVEFVMWVVYADLDLIPIIIPLIVLARGVFVDAVRAVAPSKGLAPFDLLRSSIGRFLVKSPWLRTPYAVAKGGAFFFLAVTHSLYAANVPSAETFHIIAYIGAGIAFILCLLRGLPVLIEAPQALQES